jgi:hypothetical protein
MVSSGILRRVVLVRATRRNIPEDAILQPLISFDRTRKHRKRLSKYLLPRRRLPNCLLQTITGHAERCTLQSTNLILLRVFDRLPYCVPLSPEHGASSACEWRDCPQQWKVAVNILNKQPRTNEKRWSSSLVVEHGANKPYCKK